MGFFLSVLLVKQACANSAQALRAWIIITPIIVVIIVTWLCNTRGGFGQTFFKVDVPKFPNVLQWVDSNSWGPSLVSNMFHV